MRYFICLMILSQPVWGQSDKADKKRQDLKKIREEIRLYKDKIETEVAKEKSMLDMLSALDRDIDLTRDLLEQIKKMEAKNTDALLLTANAIKATRLEIERLQDLYSKRLVYFYKYGRSRDLELLLSASSFNQLAVWIKYQKLLSANDRRNYQNILEKKRIIENKKDDLKEVVLDNRRIIKEKTVEEENLNQRKAEREHLLTRVRANKKLYAQKLKEYEISAREIEKLINVQEVKRISGGVVQKTEFPGLKRRMIWPLQGEVITRFGKYRHPQLNTVTESIGIDIQARYGQEVRVVADGMVTAITWQRGRGNIVIVNHYGGYYTVYTHLSKLLIQVDEKVALGQVIGEAGDSGSLKGPVLHFEIWQNNKALDPSQWLS